MGLQKLLSRKININITGKKLTLPLIPLIAVLCCCSCFAFAAINLSLREIGVLPTFTVSPTQTTTTFPSETPSPESSDTPAPTETLTPEPSNTPAPSETATLTPLPTETPTVVDEAVVIIKKVNKEAEYVDLENIGNLPQDLSGWKIVSEKGNQTCRLAGVINAGASLRVWTDNPNGDGYNCNLGSNIWNNDELDPAVLYDDRGVEVSRFP